MEVNSNWTDSVFEGTADLPAEEQFPHLLEEGLAGAEQVTLDLFRHLAALVSCLSLPLCHHTLQHAQVRPISLELLAHDPAGVPTSSPSASCQGWCLQLIM